VKNRLKFLLSVASLAVALFSCSNTLPSSELSDGNTISPLAARIRGCTGGSITIERVDTATTYDGVVQIRATSLESGTKGVAVYDTSGRLIASRSGVSLYASFRLNFYQRYIFRAIQNASGGECNIGSLNAFVTFSFPGAPSNWSPPSPPSSDSLYVGQFLASGYDALNPARIYSLARNYHLDFTFRGNLQVISPTDGLMWESNTRVNGSSRLNFDTDGVLRIKCSFQCDPGTEGVTVWSTPTQYSGAYRLTMQGDRNLTLSSYYDRPIWSSWGGYIGDRLKPGWKLGINERLNSTSGKLIAAFENSGNFVIYRTDGSKSRPLWAKNAVGYTVTHLTMTSDGDLAAIYNNGGLDVEIWRLGIGGRGAVEAIMQSDGNFVFYNAQGQAVWGSNTWQSDLQ
jgi:hypothetical protein